MVGKPTAKSLDAIRENGRKGPGRPREPGSYAAGVAARTAYREEMQRAMHQALGGDEDFTGSSYDLLKRVYQSAAFPVPIRLDAANTCIRYEKPMLSTVTVAGDASAPLQVIHNIMGLLNGTGRDLPSKSRGQRVSPADEPAEEYADEPTLEAE